MIQINNFRLLNHSSSIQLILGNIIFLIVFLFHTSIEAEGIKINGEIQLPEGLKQNGGGHDVVLLKYILNEEGDIINTGPVTRGKSDAENQFKFSDVPRDLRAAYRIGTRVGGQLHQSKIFFMNEKDSEYEISLKVPGIAEDLDLLKVERVSLILEPGVGRIIITEVWMFQNSSNDIIDSRKNPIHLYLPENFSDFKALNISNPDNQGYHFKKKRLNIMRFFLPGQTQMVFQYGLVSFFGRLHLEKVFKNSLEIVHVFTPVNQLELSSEQLSYRGEKKMHDVLFSSWRGMDIDSGKLELRVTSVPVEIRDYAVVGLGLLLVLSFMVLIFYRYRLKPD